MRSLLFLLLVCFLCSCEQQLDIVEHEQEVASQKTALDPLILADVEVGSCCSSFGRVKVMPGIAPPPAMFASRKVTFNLDATTHAFYSAEGGLQYVLYRKGSNGYSYYKTLTSAEISPEFCLVKGDYRCVIISMGCSFSSIDWEAGCGYDSINGKSCMPGQYFAASDALCFSVGDCGRIDIIDIDDQG